MLTEQDWWTPGNPERALHVLPDRSYPAYKTDEVVEHLVHLKENIIRIKEIYESDNFIPRPNDRFIPLGSDDIKELEKLSFRRGDVLATIKWECLIEEKAGHFEDIFATGDHNYRWWQFTKMVPEMALSENLKLVCIETNSNFNLEASTKRSDKNSEFEVGFAYDGELKFLIKHLSRNI